MAGLPPTDADLRIAARLLAARRSSGLSQRDVGTAIGVSATQLHKYEQGRNRLTGGMIQTLVTLYGVPVEHLFDSVGTAAQDDLANAETVLRAAAEAYAAARRAVCAPNGPYAEDV